jgi:threonine/homoserine/homoserine lactone efflux protein
MPMHRISWSHAVPVPPADCGPRVRRGKVRIVTANLGGFLAVASVVIMTPGPDTALTIRNGLLGGFGGGFLTAAGVSAGQVVWALAASAGVAALLAASHPAFLAIRLAGGTYLIYLGLQSLRSLRGTAAQKVPRHTEGVAGGLALAAAFRQGLFSNLGNPKMAVFFISLLPQFAGAAQVTFAPMLALGLLFSSMTLLWLSAYSAAVARLGDVLRRHRPRQVLDALTGLSLVALGARLAVEP